MHIYKKLVGYKEKVTLKLELNKMYLVTLQNTFNAGGVYIVSTGSEASGQAAIIEVKASAYVNIVPTGKDTVSIEMTESYGYASALEIA